PLPKTQRLPKQTPKHDCKERAALQVPEQTTRTGGSPVSRVNERLQRQSDAGHFDVGVDLWLKLGREEAANAVGVLLQHGKLCMRCEVAPGPKRRPLPGGPRLNGRLEIGLPQRPQALLS